MLTLSASLFHGSRFTRSWRALAFVLALVLTFATPLQVRAQGPDPSAPDETGVLGEPQLVEADVGTGTAIASIVLYYRFDQVDYVRVPMRSTERAGIYAASVPMLGIDSTRMEYYVLAEDDAGGRLAKGSAERPLVRGLVTFGGAPGYEPPATTSTEAPAEAPIVSSTPSVTSEPEVSTDDGKYKYLYYVLGVLAVGAIAAAASSGGGGGGGGGASGDACGAAGCDLTLVLPPVR